MADLEALGRRIRTHPASSGGPTDEAYWLNTLEFELARIYAGEYGAQEGADRIAAAWERITDQIGRESQIALYRASLGL